MGRSDPPERDHLPGEAPTRAWRDGDLQVDILPVRDLGNSSFLITDRESRAAVVIDPTRDVSRYLNALDRLGLSLKWALDTHLHADFISGGKELADLAGGRFGLSDQVAAQFPHDALSEEDRMEVGSATLVLVRSPGHTPEHVSFLLQDPRGRPRVLFSGGSLMAGTAARPDLLGPQYTNALVREEYVTLHDRYRTLDDSVMVLPTHAGGSFCGVGARAVEKTNLQRERRSNPLMRARDLASFFAVYLSDQPYPTYYGLSREANLSGGRPVGRIVPPLPAVDPKEVDRLRNRPGVTILDVRPAASYEKAHIPGSISIPSEGSLIAWVGWLRPESESFVLVDGNPAVRRTVQVGLMRIGYDGLLGYLDGGVAAYTAAGFRATSTSRTTMAGVRRRMEDGSPFTLLDVRNPDEAARVHVPGSINIPLPRVEQDAGSALARDLPLFVHCQSGYRAGIAVSLLERMGFHDIRHVTDGPERWPRVSARGSRGLGSRSPRASRGLQHRRVSH